MKIGANKGKKPGAEKAPEKKAPEKKVKRKSRGGGNALAAAKKFFIEHIEKLMLGLMALVAAMLIFRGFSNESMKDSPDTVSTAISRADNVVNAPTWAEEKKKRYAESDNFDEQANQDVISVDLASYDMSRPMYLPMQERRRRRIDPELLAPVELEVKPGYGAVAVRSPAESAGIATALDRNSPDTRPIPDVMMQANRRSTWSSGAGKYEGRFFITITGLVPYKAQFAKFEEAFKDADAYNPERDLPNYGGLQIERAEVVNGQTGEWKALDTETAMFKEPAKWEARVDEMADRTHVLPGANLTMAIPPLYRRSVEQWATHSKVPLDTTGEGSGGGMRTEMRGGENRGEGAGRREGEEALMEEGASGGFFSGGGGGGGESRGELRKPEGAAEGAENTMETAKPRIEGEFALLRYFDFTVELGKTYVYRVRVMLEDPNNPFEGVRPPNSALETEAVVRRNQATEKFRLSSWSTPSAPVSVQAGTQVLAGEVAQPRTISLRDGRVRIESKPADEPIAQVVAMTWKADGPYDVPIPTPVRRGSVLNGNKADAEGVDPTVNKIRKATHNYVTNTLIADIYGGVPLDAKGLTSPGYLLVMSPEGQLEVRSEVQDVASVAENVIPPDDEEKSGMMEGEEGRREGGAEVRTEGGRETGGNGRRPRSGGNRSRNRPGGGREGGGREEGGREGGGPEAR